MDGTDQILIDLNEMDVYCGLWTKIEHAINLVGHQTSKVRRDNKATMISDKALTANCWIVGIHLLALKRRYVLIN